MEQVAVPAALAGVRIDRAVSFLTGRSRAEVATLIAAGEVSAGGVVVTERSRRVAEGELLEFTLAVAGERDRVRPAAEVAFTVVHAEESFLVIDKPAGLVVHPGAGHRDDTLVAGLLHRFPDLVDAASAGAGEAERPGIVHRLDKETSGLLVVARTPDAYRALGEQFAEHSARRRYLALAVGNVEATEGTIEAPIGRSRRQPTKMAVTLGGRDATTHYRVLERFSSPRPLSFLELGLETGRTHQIRVHLAAVGHPVAGDGRYGGRVPIPGLTRPFLHAAELEFAHPLSGELVSFRAELPDELASVLDALRAER